MHTDPVAAKFLSSGTVPANVAAVAISKWRPFEAPTIVWNGAHVNEAPVLSLPLRPEWSIAVALAVGLLIGAERERRKVETDTHRPAGVRTFALVGVLGGVSALIGVAMNLLACAFVVVGALAGYVAGGRRDRDLTGEVALVATFVLGSLARERPALAMETGVLVAALLAYRQQIHRLVRDTLTEQELLDGMAFAIAAAVILPILPNRTLDPFGLFNPFTLWRLVVVAMAMSAIGYCALRIVGARFGLVVAGLAGGLVSATAAVGAMAQRSRADVSMAAPSAAGAIAALFASIVYMLGLVVAVSPDLLHDLALPLTSAAIVMLGYAAVLGLRTTAAESGPAPTGRAFNFGQALVFVGIVASFMALSRGLESYMGAAGAMVGAATTGLVDAHAAAVSMAALFTTRQITETTAALAVLTGLTTNMLIKIPVALTLGAPPYAMRVTLGIALTLAGLWSGFLLNAVFLTPGRT